MIVLPGISDLNRRIREMMSLPLPIKWDGYRIVVDEDAYFSDRKVIKKKALKILRSMNKMLETINTDLSNAEKKD